MTKNANDNHFQKTLREHIAELQEAQYARASKIEDVLVAFERRQLKKSVKTVQDYIALSVHQRRLMGVSEQVVLDVHVSQDEVQPYEEQARNRLKMLENLKKDTDDR